MFCFFFLKTNTREAATSPLYESVPLNLCGPAFGRSWVDLRGNENVIMRRRHTRLRCRTEGSCSNDEESDGRKKRSHDDDDNNDDENERKTKKQRKDKDDEKDKMS